MFLIGVLPKNDTNFPELDGPLKLGIQTPFMNFFYIHVSLTLILVLYFDYLKFLLQKVELISYIVFNVKLRIQIEVSPHSYHSQLNVHEDKWLGGRQRQYSHEALPHRL